MKDQHFVLLLLGLEDEDHLVMKMNKHLCVCRTFWTLDKVLPLCPLGDKVMTQRPSYQLPQSATHGNLLLGNAASTSLVVPFANEL